MFPRYFPTDPLQYTRHTTSKLASLNETVSALGCRNVAVVDAFLHNRKEIVDLWKDISDIDDDALKVLLEYAPPIYSYFASI